MSASKKQSDEPIEIDEKGKESKKTEEKKPVKPIAIKNESGWQRFVNWYKTNKKKSIPLSVFFVVLLLAAIPWSRYALAGTVLKNNYSVEAIDSTAGTPISGADVSLGGASGITDAAGKANLKNVKVGHQQLVITKKYYKDSAADVLVPISKQKSTSKFQLVAIGRQVKINVKNLINHQTLADVNIKVAGVSAKTDKTGSAIVVLPAGTTSEKATLSLDSYNNADVTVQVDDKTIKENDFNLTPSGKVYFLSKLSGKIDVVKTNLDGTARKTVLAGTGTEDDQDTVLLASRDWKHLALKAKRDGKAAKLYLIETDNDTMTTMDSTNATFNPVGWYDDNFVYTLDRNDIQYYADKNLAIKSYDASGKQLKTIDETAAEPALIGTIYENFGTINVVDDQLVYAKTWSAQYYPSYVSGKQMTIISIKSDGSSKKVLARFDEPQGSAGFISSNLYKPDAIYYRVTTDGNNYDYKYENSAVKPISKLSDDDFYKQYSTYLLSPSDKETLWSDSRDGKNALFIADDKGQNGKQIAALADFKPYGWFTDDYLLVSKNSSELYIMPKTGIDDKTQPLKITDYHKPAQNFYGYGGGYGGI
jgi:hypothetical protein